MAFVCWVFGFLMFFIGVIVLRSKPEYDNDYGFDDEEDDEETSTEEQSKTSTKEDTKPE